MNVNRLIALVAVLILPFVMGLFAQDQTRKEFTRAVQEADMSYYYDEDYQKAASLYEPLLKANPDNENLAAKLGICYLNIEGKKKDALRLLKIASTNVAAQNKDYTDYGDKAPVDARMYLAMAYQRNDSLDKAMALFKELKLKLNKTEIFKEDYLDKQINSCAYAIEMKKKPMTILSELYIPWLEKYPGACDPVISLNDSVFVFTQKTEGKTRIYCSYKKDTWDFPVEITRQLGGYDRFYSNSITGDGRLLVLYMDDGGDGNLYFSERKGLEWGRIKTAGKNINSVYWESHGFITPDGKTLYFSSNRTGGEGELDIWSSARNADGTWNRPVNLGKTINTPYNEDTPFFDPAEGALIFSSAGHTSMGGYDIFRSVIKNNNWTNPIGMPYAFNTTSDNTFFVLNNKGSGFITSLYDEGRNSSNIYKIIAKDPSEEVTIVEGIVSLSDGLIPDPEKLSVRLTDLKKTSSPVVIPVSSDRKYRFEIRPGDYRLDITYPGYKHETKDFNLPLFYGSNIMPVTSILVPDKVADGKYLTIKNILFAFNSSELDSMAIQALEELKTILISNPELKIQVSGYTDAVGTPQYNLQLAEKRGKAIVDYLTSQAVPVSRFISKAYGESDFIAVNTHEDGSDNPEGRKFNRRVEFGIVDPQTGVTLNQDIYAPEHLRLPSSMKYSVVLIRSPKRLQKEYFSKLSLGGKLSVRSIESDSISIYAVGVFYNRPDAVTYMGHVKELGFKDANVINQYDLNDEAKTLAKRKIIVSLATGKRIYTIQLLAIKSPVSMDMYKDLKGVREILDDDGFYKYVVGEYETQAQAQEALKAIQNAGFKDAIVRELNSLIIQ